MKPGTVHIENQEVNHPTLTEKKVSLFIKREDLIHPFISGNKYRKLKYNIKKAREEGKSTLLTFGGAFSNHIVATACAAKENGFQSIGIIRGEELAFKWKDNPTLVQAVEFGMQLRFISRTEYKEKHLAGFRKKLKAEFGDFYLLPEGGTNGLAVKGCTEILTGTDTDFDTIACCVGTGGTISGIINSASANQWILGFPALKGNFLKEDIRKFAVNDNWGLQTDYHFGGYGKISEELIDFINDFQERTGIPIDPVYTAKMLYGIFDMAQKDKFRPQVRILAIHTGGLQGIAGMNVILKKKNLPLIDLI